MEKKTVKEIDNVSHKAYNITDNESCVWIAAYFNNGSIMYFNPVIKYKNSIQQKMPKVQLDYLLSILQWFISGLIFYII